MALPVTVSLQPAAQGGFQFVYSSPEPNIVSSPNGGAPQIRIPFGLQVLSLTLDASGAGADAAFIDDPVVWMNEAGELRGAPAGMIVGRLSNTQVLITVDNQNNNPIPIPSYFFLVVLTWGPNGVGIFGSDPILIEDPPGG